MTTDISKVVSAGVGPIIVISACGLLCSAFYTRLTNILTRLRAFQRERLTEITYIERETDAAMRSRRTELLEVLGRQTEHLVRRAHLVRKTLFCLLSAIASLILCSLSLGIAAIYQPFFIPAVCLFVLGLAILLTGLGFAFMDLKFALAPVEWETTYVGKRVLLKDTAE
jgi:hypothetical protein